ncbi:MAG: 3-deoxy-manno-octulosonate cytidylyltransferase [Lysobacterales bacterium]
MTKPIEFVVAIPARFGSTRLPGKPLCDIGGQSMIARVVARAVQSGARAVVVATDDARIVAALHDSPARVLLTRADHRSGSDRLAEAADLCGWPDATVVVNLQGDEPFAPPAGIRAVAELLLRADTPMATLCTPIDSAEHLFSPHTVKVIGDANGHALYFSRAPIPFARDAFAAAPGELPAGVRYLRHLGIYAYRAGFLRRFAAMPQSDLERIESLEQLRAIEAGVPIALAETPFAFPPGVDTEADLQRAIRGLRTED